jgi:hypothetical protein
MDVTKVRKNIGRKSPEEIEKLRKLFIEGINKMTVNIIDLINNMNIAVDNHDLSLAVSTKKKIQKWSREDGPVPEGFKDRLEVYRMAENIIKRYFNSQGDNR